MYSFKESSFLYCTKEGFKTIPATSMVSISEGIFKTSPSFKYISMNDPLSFKIASKSIATLYSKVSCSSSPKESFLIIFNKASFASSSSSLSLSSVFRIKTAPFTKAYGVKPPAL